MAMRATVPPRPSGPCVSGPPGRGRRCVHLGIAAFFAVVTILSLAVPTAAQRLTVPAEAMTKAQGWLEVLDAGRHEAAWRLAGRHFREDMGKAEWLKAAQAAQAKLGKNTGREPIDVRRARRGQPGDDCFIVLFGSTYTQVPYTTETLTMCREAGEWSVAGYFVR